MKIIHIADLHLSTKEDIDNAQIFKDKIIESLKNIIKNDAVMMIFSGDYVDQGKDYFDKAFDFLCELENDIQQVNKNGTYLGIYCCPGNHDSSNASLELFNCMYKRINQESCHSYSKKNTVQFVELSQSNLDLFLVNSSYEDDYKSVHVNIEHLRHALEKSKALNKIVVLHHPVINSENSNNASLKNAHEFLLLIQEYNVSLVLHSHVHQADCIPFGHDGVSIISVGTLLSESGKNINNQFNLIALENNDSISVNNYKYNADHSHKGAKGGFIPALLWEKKKMSDNQSIISSSFKDIYDRLYSTLSANNNLMNISVCYKNQFSVLQKEIHTEFSEALVKAEQWQAAEKPANLAFNHGERIYSNFVPSASPSPFEYVIKALEKDYNNRAIIPLYTSQEVKESKDGNLPSFTLIQCGFSDETKSEFVLTLYLRAWEISKFAKINICELFLVCEKVKKKYGTVKNVNINIFAFRSHIHKDFSCFEKASLDIKENIIKVANYIATHQVDKIIALLAEKKQTNETVIVLDGLVALKENVQAALEIETEKGDSYYSKELLENLSKLVLLMEEIKDIRSQNSNAEATDPYMAPLGSLYDNVIEGFQKCNGEVK